MERNLILQSWEEICGELSEGFTRLVERKIPGKGGGGSVTA